MGRSKGTDEVFCTACGARIKRAAAHCPHCGVPNEWHDPAAAPEQNQGTEPGRKRGTDRSVRRDSAPPDQRSPSEVQATRDAAAAAEGAAEAAEGAAAAEATEAAEAAEPAETAESAAAAAAAEDAEAAGGPTTAATAPRERDEARPANWWYGVAAFGVAWIVVLAAWATGTQHGALGAIALLAWVGLPASLSQDAAFVRQRSDWQPSGGPWAFAALVPVLNVFVATIYLIRRHEVLGTP